MDRYRLGLEGFVSVASVTGNLPYAEQPVVLTLSQWLVLRGREARPTCGEKCSVTVRRAQVVQVVFYTRWFKGVLLG